MMTFAEKFIRCWKTETWVWKQVTVRVFQHALNQIIQLQVDKMIQVHKTRDKTIQQALNTKQKETLQSCYRLQVVSTGDQE